MNSIIHKLSEIESAATSIVEHAEAQREMLGQEMQQKTEEFDKKLAADTEAKLDALRSNLKVQMDDQLDLMSSENVTLIQNFQREYKEKHELYAQEILKRITEV